MVINIRFLVILSKVIIPLVFQLQTIQAFNTIRSSSKINHPSFLHKMNRNDSTSLNSTNNSSSSTEKSTLLLLEHVNLNVPNHDYILDFYLNILGMGLDPRRAENVVKGSGTVWTNCGASQFHLPYGDTAQVIPGHIGLFYNDLNGLKSRLKNYDDVSNDKKPFVDCEISIDARTQREYIRIVDRYGNVFYCREQPTAVVEDSQKEDDSLIYTAKQPIIHSNHGQHGEMFPTLVEKYCIPDNQETECKGISYIEFNVPKNTAERIAEFYDCVFDAITTVIPIPTTTTTTTDGSSQTEEEEPLKIAIIGFGTIDTNTGKASQSLLFRETTNTSILQNPYDGHHIALYVGESQKDFEQAFKNCDDANVVWVNPRFSDKAMNLTGAKKWNQFRFKDIVDLKTGNPIFELEHEVRCIHHEAFPGPKK